MRELTIELHSNEEIWSLFDKKVDSILIHRFIPNETLEWWKTDFKTNHGRKFKNLSVRLMEMDVQTDLPGLKKILELNTRQLRIYQFEKPTPDTLEISNLSQKNRNRILKQNGMKHFFFVNFEYLTISSFDSEFLTNIETNPIFAKRILDRKIHQ